METKPKLERIIWEEYQITPTREPNKKDILFQLGTQFVWAEGDTPKFRAVMLKMCIRGYGSEYRRLVSRSNTATDTNLNFLTQSI